MFVKCDGKENFTPVQFYLDRDIDLPDAERIASVSATARTTGVEALEGEARVSYRVTYRIIYKDEGGYAKVEEFTDDTATVKSSAITPKGFVAAYSKVVATEFVGVKKLKIRAMLEIKGYVIAPNGFEIMEPTEALCTRLETVDVERITPIPGGETLIEGEESIADNIDEVFAADSEICIETVSTATDICEIKGICYTYLTYLTGGELASKTITSPFTAEVLAEGVMPSDRAHFVGTVVSTGVSVTAAEGGSDVKIEAVVYMKGFAVGVSQVDIVADAYSKTKEIKLTQGHAAVEVSECATASHERFAGSVPVECGEAGLKSILAIGAPWIGACNVRNSDGLTVEGIVGAEVIYMDGDGEVGRTLAEIPYRFLLGEDFGCKSELSASATVSALNARVRPGDIIEFNGEVCVEVHGSSDKEITYIAAYEELCDREESNVAISLYIVREGETLFDVAKELLSDEAELMAMNPDMELPLRAGEKVVVVR